jgi:uracil-DNA glycosylase
MVTIVNDNLGDDDNKVVFIFACPGKKEEKHNIVCYGSTGTNLDKLLRKLNEIDPSDFKKVDRYNYMILNSYQKVYPNSEDPQKTEPEYFEIDEIDNLERIYNNIKDKEIVIGFGDCAKHAYDSVKAKYSDLNVEFVEGEHLSPRHLNRAYKSEETEAKARNIHRIIQASENIIDFAKSRNENE